MGGTWIVAQLLRRPLATLAMAGVLALVGGLVGTAVAWQQGLDRATQTGAHPDIVYLVARGAEDAVERSLIEPRHLAGLEAQLWTPASIELVHMGLVEVAGTSRRVSFRGISSVTPTVRDNVVIDGAWPGQGEAVVGDRVARELALDAGDEIRLLDAPLRVVGRLPAGLGFTGSEVWLPRADLLAITGREGASLIALRDGADLALMTVMTRPDWGLVDVAEVGYLAAFAARMRPLRVIAWLVSGLLGLAALAGALTAAVARAEARKGVLATLRSLGVTPLRLGIWLLGENLVVALIGFGLAVLALQAVDGTVLRLGGIAPVLAAGPFTHLACALAVLVTSFVFITPVLTWVFVTALPEQLKHR